MNTDRLTQLAIDYEQTLAYFHALHDVRFRLFGFLPTLTGLAVVLAPDHTTPGRQLALACAGLVVTLGLASYDQRNTQIYDRLVTRARFLERHLRLLPLPGGDKGGGTFHCRPPLRKTLGARLVWHIQGLILVYAASLAAWFFLGISAIAKTTWIVGLPTFAAFVLSYLLLRWISNTHYEETKHIAKLVEECEVPETD